MSALFAASWDRISRALFYRWRKRLERHAAEGWPTWGLLKNRIVMLVGFDRHFNPGLSNRRFFSKASLDRCLGRAGFVRIRWRGSRESAADLEITVPRSRKEGAPVRALEIAGQCAGSATTSGQPPGQSGLVVVAMARMNSGASCSHVSLNDPERSAPWSGRALS